MTSDKNGPDKSWRYWWNEFKPLLVKILWGHPLRRFFTFVFGVGVSLFTPTLFEMIFELLSKTIERPPDSPPENGLSATDIGLGLIIVGIGGHIAIFVWDKRTEARERKLMVENKIRLFAGKLTQIAQAFGDPVAKPPAFMWQEIEEARDLALELKPTWRSPYAASPIFAAICDPMIDAKGVDPMYGVNSQTLEKFAEDILNEL